MCPDNITIWNRKVCETAVNGLFLLSCLFFGSSFALSYCDLHYIIVLFPDTLINDLNKIGASLSLIPKQEIEVKPNNTLPIHTLSEKSIWQTLNNMLVK